MEKIQMSSTRILNNMLLVMFSLFTCRCTATSAGFNVCVIDADTGRPMTGVEVVGWFANSNGWRAWTESALTYECKMLTNENGFCHVTGETNNGEVGFDIDQTPMGYYRYVGWKYRFVQKTVFPLVRWCPTDLVITAALHKIERPIPLFIRKTVLGNGQDISERVKEEFSYDLLKAAWLPPIGNGEHADIIFKRLPRQVFGKVSNPYVTAYSYKDTIVAEFDGDDNGIVEMKSMPNTMSMIRTAPETGYGKSYKVWHSIDDAYQHQESRAADRNLCFRIRTKKNEKGEIIEAYYGKIYGDIGAVADKKNLYGVTFTYYLNPTPNDRNLEWDMKHNLCPTPGDIGNPRP